MKHVAAMIGLLGLLMVGLAPPVGEITAVSAAEERAPDQTAVTRMTCGPNSVGSAQTEISDLRTSDLLEALQARYESEEGFRAVIFNGQTAWIIVSNRTFEHWRDADLGKAVGLAISCVPDDVITASLAAVSSAQLGAGQYAATAYDALRDIVVVDGTVSAEQMDSAIRAELAVLNSPLADSSLDGVLEIDSDPSADGSRLSGRLNDSTPFYSGGKIIDGATGDACSTGLYINSTFSGTVMVTAGHCGPTGSHWYNGQSTNHVGDFENRHFPNPDLVALDGESYAAVSFSGNDNSTVSNITSGANPSTGIVYCNMGFKSQRTCEDYSSLVAQFCDAGGCTSDLALATRPACGNSLALGAPGDSGGGVYKENGTLLSARGTVVAGDYVSGTCKRWDHKLQTILTYYSASLVTI